MKNTALNGTGFAKPRRRPLHDKMCLLLIGLLTILPAVSVAEDQKDDKGGGETPSVFVHAVEATGDCLVHAFSKRSTTWPTCSSRLSFDGRREVGSRCERSW